MEFSVTHTLFADQLRAIFLFAVLYAASAVDLEQLPLQHWCTVLTTLAVACGPADHDPAEAKAVAVRVCFQQSVIPASALWVMPRAQICRGALLLESLVSG